VQARWHELGRPWRRWTPPAGGEGRGGGTVEGARTVMGPRRGGGTWRASSSVRDGAGAVVRHVGPPTGARERPPIRGRSRGVHTPNLSKFGARTPLQLRHDIREHAGGEGRQQRLVAPRRFVGPRGRRSLQPQPQPCGRRDGGGGEEEAPLCLGGGGGIARASAADGGTFPRFLLVSARSMQRLTGTMGRVPADCSLPPAATTNVPVGEEWRGMGAPLPPPPPLSAPVPSAPVPEPRGGMWPPGW